MIILSKSWSSHLNAFSMFWRLINAAVVPPLWGGNMVLIHSEFEPSCPTSNSQSSKCKWKVWTKKNLGNTPPRTGLAPSLVPSKNRSCKMCTASEQCWIKSSGKWCCSPLTGSFKTIKTIWDFFWRHYIFQWEKKKNVKSQAILSAIFKTK